MKQDEHLQQILTECMTMLDHLGIRYTRPKSVTAVRRTRKRFGLCKRNNGEYVIEIMAALCDGKHDDALRTVVYHELLHTCRNALDHGREWTALARKVSDYTGYSIKRENTYAEYDLLDSVKYVFKCNNCGTLVCRFRKSDFTENYTQYRCAKCKGRLSVVKYG